MEKKLLLALMVLLFSAHVHILWVVRNEGTGIRQYLDEQRTACRESLNEHTHRVDLVYSRINHHAADLQERQKKIMLTLDDLVARQLRLSSEFQSLRAGLEQEAVALSAGHRIDGLCALSGTLDPRDDLEALRYRSEGKAQYDAGAYGVARALLEEAITRAPDDLDSRLFYAAASFFENPADSGRYVDIRQQLKRVLIEDPDSCVALEILGKIALEEQEWELVRRYFGRLLLEKSGTHEEYEILLLAHYECGTLHEVSSLLNACVRDFPVDPWFTFYAGVVAEDRQDYEEALRYYSDSCSGETSLGPAMTGLLRTALKSGRIETAVNLLSQPDIPPTYEMLKLAAEFFSERSDYARAKIYCRMAIESLTETSLDTSRGRQMAIDGYRAFGRILYAEGMISELPRTTEQAQTLFERFRGFQ